MKNFYWRLCAVFVWEILFGAASLQAAEPQIWTVDTRAEVLRGDARGVSITDTGAIVLAPRLSEVFNTQQSFVWSSAIDNAGNVYLGTGSDGRLFKIDASDKGSLFAKFGELDITALAIGADKAVYAATSPDGKVYRVQPDGKFEVYFDPPDKYIWSLAFFADGSLAVGTGESGKIYRVKAAGAVADASLLFDSSETHIISLAVDKNNNLIAGTDAGGIVLRISPEGKAFALLDTPTPLREIHSLSIANDNSIYALALSDSASSGSPASAATGSSVPTPSGATATVVATNPAGGGEEQASQQPPRSRNDVSQAKSAVYRIAPDGGSEIVWSSNTVTAFSLQANPAGGGFFIGTSDKGRIYSITNEGRETLLLQSNEGQISTFKTRGGEILATSSNGGKLYRFGTAESVAEGIFDSNVRDAKTAALWGRIWWRGTGNIQLQTRTGNTDKPDATWSDWSAAVTDGNGAAIGSPRARFFQYRVVLRGASVVLNSVSVSYLPRNIAPEVLRIEVLPTNVGLQPNPPPQIDPNIESSGLDAAAFGLPATQNIPPRRLYQRAARSLIWTAEDRNGDKLEYSVYYRAVGEQNFRLLKDKLRDNFYTIDGAALADGGYVFKIVASDAPSNPAGQSLTGERATEIVEIDNTPPVVTVLGTPTVTSEKARITFAVEDAASGVRRAEFSLDAQEWQTIYADDGISDSRRETYTVEIPIAFGEHTISLRAFDANGNVGSFRISVRR
jgi:WD40 repeat protein